MLWWAHLGSVWIFFSSLITPHSIFVTYHSSLLTYHLKYPNFLYASIRHTFSTSHHSIFSTFCGTYTWAPCQAFMLAYPPHTISSQNQRLQPRHSFFFFPLQPPIPTTTTSVPSLKHKPTKFISILEAPGKFTNPQQPIRCPNCWFFIFIF